MLTLFISLIILLFYSFTENKPLIDNGVMTDKEIESNSREEIITNNILRKLFSANDTSSTMNGNFAWNKTKDNYLLKKGIFNNRIRLLFVLLFHI